MVDNAAAAALKTVFAYLVILACISPCLTLSRVCFYSITFLCLNVMLYACSVLLNFSQILNRVLRFIKKYLKIVYVKDMGAGLH